MHFTFAALIPLMVTASPRPLSAFGPGEQLTFKVHYLGLTAGTTQITIGSTIQMGDELIWPIVMLAKTQSLVALFPVKDKFVSYWDPLHQKSVGSELWAEENHKRRHQKIRIDSSKLSAHITTQKESESLEQSEVPIEPGAMDIAAATFALRNKPLKPGESFTQTVFTGRKSFLMTTRIEEETTILTPLGPKSVLKARASTSFSGSFRSDRDLRIYFSTDASHVPVRIEADFVLGSIVGELTDYKAGQKGP